MKLAAFNTIQGLYKRAVVYCVCCHAISLRYPKKRHVFFCVNKHPNR